MARNASVSRADFIRAWEGSESIAEVSEKTGLAKPSCQTKASKLRGDGIPLKQFARAGRKQESVESALALLAELRGVDVETIREEAAENQN